MFREYDLPDDYDEYTWKSFQDYVNQLNKEDVLDEVLDSYYGTKNTLAEDHALRKKIRSEIHNQEEPNHKSAIDEFFGLIDGISFDGVINSLEVDALRQWIDNNHTILSNSRYSSFLHSVEEIICDGIVDDSEREYLIKQAYMFKADIIGIDDSLNNLKGILKGITCDNIIVESEVMSLCQWIVDNDRLSGISIYDKLCDVLGNILDDGVITTSEMGYLQSYITHDLIPDSSGDCKADDSYLSKSENYVFERIREILEYEKDGLRARIIAARMPGTQTVDINHVLYKYKEMFVQDDDFRWHLRALYEKLTDAEKDVLKSILTREIQDLELVKQKFFQLTDNDNTDKINQVNMLEMGYQIAGPIIYRSKTQTINDYLKWFLQNDLIVDLSDVDRIATLAQANKTINDLKNQYTIVEFEKLKFINIKKLEEVGITKERLIDYVDKACAFARKQYFNIKSICEDGFTNFLDDYGFEPFFYESLLKASGRCSAFSVDGVCIFLEGATARGLPEMIERFVNSHGSIDIYDLIDSLNDKYGINVGKRKIENCLQSTELYYSKTMEKVYRDYDEFFAEV